MTSRDYIEMNVDELYECLVHDVMENPVETRELLDSLSQVERYREDSLYRAIVDTAKTLSHGVFKEMKKVIPICKELIERTLALQLWRAVSLNWNILGSAYASKGLYERALECYLNVLLNEKKNGLQALASTAYYNIAVIYNNFKEYEKTYQYFLLAIAAVEAGGVNQPNYYSKLVLYWSNLVKVLCHMNRMEEIPPLFEKMDAVGKENLDGNVIRQILSSRMTYSFYISQFEKGKEEYKELKKLVRKDDIFHRMMFFGNYLELCRHFELDYDFFSEELMQTASLPELEHSCINLQLNKELRLYYDYVGKTDQFYEISDRYIHLLEEDAEEVRRSQSESLKLVEDLLLNVEDMEAVMIKNRELELMAQEALRHKQSLQKAYDRIELINELGRKMTSSLNLEEVLSSIYNILCAHLPVSIFILLVAEPEEDRFRSVAYFQDGIQEPDFCIGMNDSRGFFTECYRTNRLISTADESYSEFLKKELKLQRNARMQSAIYMPLNVGDKLIGLCSIQDRQENAYTKDQISFLEALSPYLSIALNNAVRSWVLEGEIQSHLKTQAELKKANEKLERISSLDGLTQISSRRDFQARLTVLLANARKNEESVCVLMMDIDNFKAYNDTYGHLQGDEVLKAVAKIIRDNMDGVEGLSARFGGEEFIGACAGMSEEACKKLGESICKDIYDLNIQNESTVSGRVTISVGIAYSDEIRPRSEFMRRADEELYRSKERGKNQVSVGRLELTDQV